MSEEERRRRQDFLKIRKKRISRRTALVVTLVIIAVVASILAGVFNKVYYVNYSEKSEAKWGVILKGNDFFEDGYLGEDYSYVASLIDKIHTEFSYKLDMDAKKDVTYNYKYYVDAVIEIKTPSSDKPLLVKTDSILAPKEYSGTNNGVEVRETVFVDYHKYDKIANDFVSIYLKSTQATANLIIKMKVDIESESHAFDRLTNQNDYVAAISIPLLVEAASVKISSDVPVSDGRILSYTTKAISNACSVVAILFGALSIIFGALLLHYIYSSRNHDVTYEARKARILSAYKPFIQQLVGGFDTEGYHTLELATFDDMLAIRDTIQSPILMDENEDRTATKFLIPTNTNLLYSFEIRVGDWDDIYQPKDEIAEDATEVIAEDAVPVAVEEVTEAVEEEITEAAEEEITEAVEEITETDEESDETDEEITDADEEIAEIADEDITEIIEAEDEEERNAIRYLVHADPDFRFVEVEPESEAITVDAPVDVNMGKSKDAEISFNVSYKGESLLGDK